MNLDKDKMKEENERWEEKGEIQEAGGGRRRIRTRTNKEENKTSKRKIEKKGWEGREDEENKNKMEEKNKGRKEVENRREEK
jgi:hypothetical protein